MIQSARDKETEKVLNRIPSKKFQAVQERAEERLAQLNAAVSLQDLSIPSMRKNWLGIEKGNTASGLTTNTGFASNGMVETPAKLKLLTTH
jgi:plasmid maintenance system killer protein